MGWNSGVDRATNDVISAADWNKYLGAAGSLEYLKGATDYPVKAQKEGGTVYGGRGKLNFIDDAGITVTVADDGANDRVNVTLTPDPPSKAQKAGGTVYGGRGKFNFIDGSNVTVTVADNAGSDRIDITIASSGSTVPTACQFGSAYVSPNTSQDTYGSWGQMIASSSGLSQALVIGIVDTNNTTCVYQVSVGTGGSGSETEKVTGLLGPFAISNNKNSGIMVIPFSIAASTRISGRIKTPYQTNSGTSLYVTIAVLY